MNKCIFCQQIKAEQILSETEHFMVIFDINPVQDGHLLIVSKKHYMDIREMPDEVLFDLVKLEKILVSKIAETFATDGVTIAANNGSIMDEGTHCHVHVIPRYKNDGFWDNQKVVQHENDILKLKAALQLK
ncbi:HIT family protein [Lactococcus lactis]|uniref:HIT family protein n=1 Tax=Lactococcus lactis TaxID=1358 RepID=UPI00288F44D6|nr:HIT family protein [Lactococcus lactis]MDT2866766.1 HIT family protein [Lactococcus lactis]MDT2918206.1 HIT family protein [Lactococcus lactis]